MTSIQRAGHSNIVIGGIAAAAIIGLTLAVVIGLVSNHRQDKADAELHSAQRNLAIQQAQQHRDEQCIERYEHRVQRRDAIVGAYAVARSRALGRVQLFQAHHPHANGPYLVRLRLAYVAADRAYLHAEHRYPTPSFTCADLPPVKVPPVKVPTPSGPTPTPHPSVSTKIVHVPGPVRVVHVPGPVRTITVPPGKAHRRHRHR